LTEDRKFVRYPIMKSIIVHLFLQLNDF
jgi:hypothetical protein